MAVDDTCLGCGMELDPGWDQCPKCDTPRGTAPSSVATATSRQRAPGAGGGGVVEVDVGHAGHAGPEVAARIDDACSRALLADAPLLRVIHGYGSAGSGGTLRDAVRRHCRDLAERGLIAAWIAGELLDRPPPPRFAAAAVHDCHNPGVTLIAW